MSHLVRPTRPILCYVTDRRSLPLSTSGDAQRLLLQSVENAALAGADWIQLREKDYSGSQWASLLGEALVAVKKANAPTRIFINDRLDVALACGAGGVHLSENGIPVADACLLRAEFFAERKREPDFLIGVSCHSLGSALGAARSGADYIYFSPIFHTPSKANYGPPQGLDRLAHICRAVRCSGDRHRRNFRRKRREMLGLRRRWSGGHSALSGTPEIGGNSGHPAQPHRGSSALSLGRVYFS